MINGRKEMGRIEKDMVGCLGFAAAILLVIAAALAVILTRLTFRSPVVLGLLAAGAVLVIAGIVFTILGKKENERRSEAYRAELRSNLRTGVRFEAVGSLAQDLEGEFIKWIDHTTIEAVVWDPRGGSREKGPFPFSRIKRIKS